MESEETVLIGITCPNCGTQLPDGTVFCTNCGSAIESEETVLMDASCPNCGAQVYDGGEVTLSEPVIDPDILAGVTDTFHLPELTEAALRLGDAPLIGMIPGQIVTEDLGRASAINVDKDILKLTVCERHHGTGHVASCYVKGYGLRRGAVAASIAHDSHNIIACGASDGDIVCAVNRMREMGGGMCVVEDGQVVAELPLPVAGLFTDRPLPEVNDALEACKRAASERGVSEGVDPFMTMSFMSLPVIPTLRLTTRGVVDVNSQTIVS